MTRPVPQYWSVSTDVRDSRPIASSRPTAATATFITASLVSTKCWLTGLRGRNDWLTELYNPGAVEGSREMSSMKRLVLDILKPNEIENATFARTLADLDGVEGTNVSLLESDKEVQNLKITIEGEAIDEAAVADAVENLGGTIHSVDEVVCGERLVEESSTHQD